MTGPRLSERATALIRALVTQPLPPPYPLPDDVDAWREAHAVGEIAAEALFRDGLAACKVASRERTVGGVAVLEVTPAEICFPESRLVYLHGGGFTFYSARSLEISAAQMAAATGRTVIAVDYTVAPAGTWQSANREAGTVIAALIREFGGDRIGVFGESAGGGLAVTSVLQASMDGADLPAAIVVMSPWADLGGTGASYKLLEGKDPQFTYTDHLSRCARAYCPDGDFDEPMASPIFAQFPPAFPPTLIHGGTHELLLSDFVSLANVLRRDGVTVDLMLVDGLTHCFPVFFRSLDVAEAIEAYAAATAHWNRWLR